MRRATFPEREHVAWAGFLEGCELTRDWHELVSEQRLLPLPDEVERYQVQADSPTHHLRIKRAGGFFLSALVLHHINSSIICSLKKQCPAMLGLCLLVEAHKTPDDLSNIERLIPVYTQLCSWKYRTLAHSSQPTCRQVVHIPANVKGDFGKRSNNVHPSRFWQIKVVVQRYLRRPSSDPTRLQG